MNQLIMSSDICVSRYIFFLKISFFYFILLGRVLRKKYMKDIGNKSRSGSISDKHLLRIPNRYVF